MATIALLTDFGVEDVYVGVMKGVMNKICPDVNLIDITHAIPPQDVRGGALALLDAYKYFPEGTVFLVVVDPGVGSARLPIAVAYDGYTFIAPDNGILTYLLSGSEDYQAHALTNPQYQLPAASSTFHGRDIFAPAAAHAASGVDIAQFGESLVSLVTLPRPTLTIAEGEIIGEVVRVDHFGNSITSIGRLQWQDDSCLVLQPRDDSVQSLTIASGSARVKIGKTTLTGIKHAYHEVATGELALQIDSTGQLEVMVNQGSAAQRLGLSVGDEVTLYYETCESI